MDNNNIVREELQKVFKLFNVTNREELREKINKLKGNFQRDVTLLLVKLGDTKLSDYSYLVSLGKFVNTKRTPQEWSENDVTDFKLKMSNLRSRIEEGMSNVDLSTVALIVTVITCVLALIVVLIKIVPMVITSFILLLIVCTMVYRREVNDASK